MCTISLKRCAGDWASTCFSEAPIQTDKFECLSVLSIVVINTVNKSSSWKRDFILSHSLQAFINGSQGTNFRQELKQRLLRIAAYWLLPHGSLSLFGWLLDFQERLSLCSPGCLGICSVGQALNLGILLSLFLECWD